MLVHHKEKLPEAVTTNIQARLDTYGVTLEAKLTGVHKPTASPLGELKKEHK